MTDTLTPEDTDMMGNDLTVRLWAANDGRMALAAFASPNGSDAGEEIEWWHRHDSESFTADAALMLRGIWPHHEEVSTFGGPGFGWWQPGSLARVAPPWWREAGSRTPEGWRLVATFTADGGRVVTGERPPAIDDERWAAVTDYIARAAKAEVHA